MMFAPFIIHDAEVALFPAWENGLPMTGPAPDRDRVAPLFRCHTTIRTSRNSVTRESSFGDNRRIGASKQNEISISVEEPESIEVDRVGLANRLASMSGSYCLVIVFWSPEDRVWQRWQYFHVRIASDLLDGGDGNDASRRSWEFTAEHVELDVYQSAEAPICVPEVLGRVDFHCGPLHVPCLTHDCSTNEWRLTPHALTGVKVDVDGVISPLPYVLWDEPTISPSLLTTSTFSLLQPRTAVQAALPSPHNGIAPKNHLNIVWQQRLFFSLATVNGQKNSLILHNGIAIEVNGSPEPIEAIDQDQILHESYVVFRVLNRIYATIGHDRIAVPAIFPNSLPVSTTPYFQLGDTVLDARGWWNLSSMPNHVTTPLES